MEIPLSGAPKHGLTVVSMLPSALVVARTLNGRTLERDAFVPLPDHLAYQRLQLELLHRPSLEAFGRRGRANEVPSRLGLVCT